MSKNITFVIKVTFLQYYIIYQVSLRQIFRSSCIDHLLHASFNYLKGARRPVFSLLLKSTFPVSSEVGELQSVHFNYQH